MAVTVHAAPAPHSTWTFLRQELSPYPGRLTVSLRIVLALVITLCIDMAFNQPEIGVSLYMVFFVSREAPAKTLKSLFVMIGLTGLTLFYSFVVQYLPGVPAANRFVAFGLIIFVGMFLSYASTLGKVFLMVGIFGEVFIQQWDTTRPAEMTVELMLKAWLSLLTGFIVGTMIELMFQSPSSLKRLQKEIGSRLQLVTGLLESSKEGHFNAGSQKLIHDATLKGVASLHAMLSNAEQQQTMLYDYNAEITGLIVLVGTLLDQAAQLVRESQGKRQDPAGVDRAVSHIEILQTSVRNFTRPAPFQDNDSTETASATLNAILATLNRLHVMLEGVGIVMPKLEQEEQRKPKFFKPDAFTNANYRMNALKVTIAAMLCWLIYKGIDWPQISTAVTTCLITAALARGDERQKQILRLSGDSLAGIVALAAIIWVLPHFDDIGGLAIVVAIIGLAGSWVYLSSPRLSYAGRQFSYCFGLAALGSTSTPTSLNEARDRVAGVFLGVLMMWLVFDQIKPAWNLDQMRGLVVQVLASIRDVVVARTTGSRPTFQATESLRKQFSSRLTSLRNSLDVLPYEFNLRSTRVHRMIPQLNRVVELLHETYLTELVGLEQQAQSGDAEPNLTGRIDELDRMIALVQGDIKPFLANADSLQADNGSADADLGRLHAALEEVLLEPAA